MYHEITGAEEPRLKGGKPVTVSKKQQASVNKYVRANYDRINVTFPKGEKETIRVHAEARGESVNAFIIRAVREALEREKAE